MIWLYGNHKQYLKDDVVPIMDEQTIMDDFERNTRPKRKPSRKRKRVIADDNDTWGRKNLREFCRTVLREMKPSPDGSLCPIKITGKNCLNYDIIITFMCVKKKGKQSID